ncbi:MAG: type II toxin-antitoxin system RelE/ParE family toxin [Opitutales bacterium]
MILKTKLVRPKGKVEIRAIATWADNEGKDPCATLKFCQEIKDKHPGELTKLTRLWNDIARNGPPSNDQKFKDLPGTNGLYEIKTTKLRVICFWDDGSLIICTHGFVKKSQKTPKNEITRAEKARNQYFHEKEKGTLEHEPAP